MEKSSAQMGTAAGTVDVLPGMASVERRDSAAYVSVQALREQPSYLAEVLAGHHGGGDTNLHVTTLDADIDIRVIEAEAVEERVYVVHTDSPAFWAALDLFLTTWEQGG